MNNLGIRPIQAIAYFDSRLLGTEMPADKK